MAFEFIFSAAQVLIAALLVSVKVLMHLHFFDRYGSPAESLQDCTSHPTSDLLSNTSIKLGWHLVIKNSRKVLEEGSHCSMQHKLDTILKFYILTIAIDTIIMILKPFETHNLVITYSIHLSITSKCMFDCYCFVHYIILQSIYR